MKKKSMKKIDVVCGILIRDGKCLIAQRASGDSVGKFEFPGGKTESGETKEEALIREFKEELNVDLDRVQFFEQSTDVQNEKEITLYCFVCTSNEKPTRFNVHSQSIWTTPDHIYDYDFFESDRKLVEKLKEEWSCLKEQMK